MARKAKTSNKKLDYTRPVSDDSFKAVLEKLVPPSGDTSAQAKGTSKDATPPQDWMRSQTERISQYRADAEAIEQILPDMEHCKRVLVAAILSPRNMYKNELGFGVDETLFNSEIAALALKPIKRYFKEVEDIDNRLSEILETVLFKEGSYSILILPENTVDDLIHGDIGLGNEAHAQAIADVTSDLSMGWIGSTRDDGLNHDNLMTGLENFGKEIDRAIYAGFLPIKSITVTDNFNVLKKSKLKEILRKNAINRTLAVNGSVSIGLESRKFSEAEISKLYESNVASARTNSPIRIIRPQIQMERKSNGHPLMVTPPAEAVIPVCRPGRPSDHIGYYLVIDPKTGSPISLQNNRDYYNEIRSSYASSLEAARTGGDEYSATLDQIRNNLGMDQNKAAATEWESGCIHEAYRNIIENNLLTSLNNGLYDEDFDITISNEIINVMLWRQMKNRSTQLLYVPVELMTYIAFDYDSNGFGESLITKTRMLHTVRASLFFATAMGKIQNARPRRRVSVTVGDKDPDPYATFEDIKSMVINQDRIGLCVGGDVANPNEQIEIIQNGGYEFKLLSNNNQGVTNEVIDYEDIRTDVNAGDEDWDKELRSRAMLAMGLQPELFDPNNNPDFAASIVNGNLLLTRQVVQYQGKFLKFINKIIRTYTLNSNTLKNEVLEIVKANEKMLTPEQKKMDRDELVSNFINAITCTLPEPNNDRIKEQSEAMNDYNTLLEAALDAYLTEDVFPEGTAKETVSLVRAVIKAKYTRDYMARNGVLPEMQELLALDKDSKPAFSILDISQQVIDTLGKAIEAFAKENEPEEEAPPAGDTGDDYGDGDDTEEGDDDDDLGDDDESDDNLDDEESDDTDDDGASGDGLPEDEEEEDEDSEEDEDDELNDNGTKSENLDDSEVDELEDEKL